MAALDTKQTPAWHAVSAGEALRQLGSDAGRGLDQGEVARRLASYGPNRLPEGAKRGPLMRFLLQFDNILVYILLAAGFVKLMLGLWLDASIITGVVVINAILGFLQEGKAEKALDSIRNMLSADARVRRDGEIRIVPAEQLVPGDIVLLESGDRVPADLRLIEVKNLRADEAALTGESLPADKSSDPVAENSTVGDREDMAFSGTLIVSGRAVGVVVATGAQTELGRINQMLSSVSVLETPLLRQIKEFGHTIAKVIGFVSVLVFAYARWVRDLPFVEAFQSIVGIAVSAIPEGLPSLITITLAIGVQRMARRNAIIRRLPAVETLGSVSRICSDKTGTLTLMEMMVAFAVTAQSLYHVTGNGYAPEGDVLLDGAPAAPSPVLKRMGSVCVLCNDSELRQAEGVWKVEGDPTEAALYPLAEKIGADRAQLKDLHRRVDAIPFESEHKFMATLHEDADGTRMLLVKGAPEVILAHCDREETDTGSQPLNRIYWEEASDRLAAQGERVLGLAWLPDPRLGSTNLAPADLPKSLILLGLVGLMDPPRKEAVESVAECHAGGIRVTMITGDHKITAAAIAKMLGIGDGKSAVAGTEIEAMNDGALQQTVRDVDVFARASPEHKLRLVKAIQANGQIVAMTGDGVNDAPALKRADIGVAMGIKGTEVTKEAAAMVLADDNFASITAAVREGRTVYNNIEKALLFMLPTNVAQALVILVAIIIGFALPITAPQILWVNMVTSVALGLVISFEPHERDVMARPPRSMSHPLLDGFAIWRICFVGVALLAITMAAFFWMKSQDASDALARAVAVNTLVIGQVFYLLNSRYKTDSSLSFSAHKGNRYLPLGIGAVIVLQLLFTYAPPFQRMFAVEPIPLRVWPWLLLGGAIFFLVVEAEKFIVRRMGLNRLAETSEDPRTALPVSRAREGASRGLFEGSDKWAALLGGLAVLGLIGGEVYTLLRERPADAPVVEKIDDGAARHNFPATVVVLERETYELRAEIAGVIQSVDCKVGEAVTAGQRCAAIASPQSEEAAKRVGDALAAAERALEKSSAALAAAQEAVTRRQAAPLVGKAGVAAPARARLELAQAESRARSDRETVERRRTDLQAVEAELQKAQVVSSIDGRIVEVKASPGLSAEAGKALFVIAPNSGAVRLKLEAAAQDATVLAPDQEIAMRVRELGAEQFYGVVRSISPSTTGSNRSEIVVDAADPRGLLKPELTLHAEILRERGQ
jgi:magnesium-transporting ATPase (P-type)/multidrug efflux pump subunit AcrA (membrane-fusion protein)